MGLEENICCVLGEIRSIGLTRPGFMGLEYSSQQLHAVSSVWRPTVDTGPYSGTLLYRCFDIDSLERYSCGVNIIIHYIRDKSSRPPLTSRD